MPTMGFTPAFVACCRNCHAPYMVPWSVSASAGISSSWARVIRSLSRFAPSRSENSEWVWRWTKDIRSGAMGVLSTLAM